MKFVETLIQARQLHNSASQSPDTLSTTATKNLQGSQGLRLIRNVKYAIGIAASLALLVLLYRGIKGGSANSTELFDTYYEAPSLGVERGTSDTTIAEIAQLYNSQSYTAVLPKLVQFVAAHPEAQNYKLALAICKLNTKDYNAAAIDLENIINSNDTFKEKAQWYLALTYLKANQKVKARALLQSFDKNHFYAAKAQTLLEALN
jgi:hypothetical protein